MKQCIFTIALLLLSFALNTHAESYAGWSVGAETGGYATIIRTTDSGNTWYRQGSGQVVNVRMNGVYAVDPMTAWVVGVGDAGYATIYFTDDGGGTWSRKGVGQPALQSNDLGKVHASGNHVWAVEKGVIAHSADGGDTWENQLPVEFTNCMLQGVFSLDGSNVWVGGSGTSKYDHATILKSIDTGQNWTRQSGGTITNADHILGISAINTNTAWAVGGDGFVVYRTDNGGTTWNQQPNPGGLGDANEVSAVSDQSVFVAVDNFVSWSTNGGAAWSTFNTPYYTMGISAVNEQEAWAVISEAIYGTGTIFHTSNGGVSWEGQGLPAGQVLGELWTVSFSRTPIPEPALAALLALMAGFFVLKRNA